MKLTKKLFKSLLVTVLTLCIILSQMSTYALALENSDKSKLDNFLKTEEGKEFLKSEKKINQYIEIDEKNKKIINLDAAIYNNETEETIESLKFLDEYYSLINSNNAPDSFETVKQMTQNKMIDLISKLTKYGNWCGKGNNGKDPIDVLDEKCKLHDLCYGARGQWDKSCDEEFLVRLIAFSSEIKDLGFYAKTYAKAAFAIFNSRTGSNYTNPF